MYDTVSEKMISGVLSRLPRRYQDYTFVDFGSGKGKVVLLAPRLPFRKVIGLEFAQQLIAVAQRNIRSFRGPPQQP